MIWLRDWSLLVVLGATLCSAGLARNAAGQDAAQDGASVADEVADDAAGDSSGDAPDEEPGFLGLIGDDSGGDGRGVRIAKIDRDSPADRGMLKEGDLIYKINDQPIRTGRDMLRVLSRMPAGANVRFYIDRDGSQKDRDVTLGQRPTPEQRERDFGVIGEPLPIPRRQGSAFPPPSPHGGSAGGGSIGGERAGDGIVIPPPPTPERATLGVRSVPPTALDQAQHGLPNLRGAVVLSIAAGSPAHVGRIPLHAVIVAIDGQNVSGPTDLARRIATFEPGQEVEVSYYYKREHHRQRVTLADTYDADGGEHFTAGNGAGDVAIVTDGPAEGGAERVETLQREVDVLKRRVEELERMVDGLRRAGGQ